MKFRETTQHRRRHKPKTHKSKIMKMEQNDKGKEEGSRRPLRSRKMQKAGIRGKEATLKCQMKSQQQMEEIRNKKQMNKADLLRNVLI